MKLKSLFLALLLFTAVLLAKEVSDATLQDEVLYKLSGDRDLGGEKIEVAVSQGSVELKGAVRQEKLRAKAERVAKRVKGVKSVDNKIKVSPTGSSQ